MKKFSIILISALALAILLFTIDLKMTKAKVQSYYPTEQNTKSKHILPTDSKLDVLIFKKEQQLELWQTANNQLTLIHQATLQLYNSEAGTRLYDKDTYLPEGIYHLKTNNDKKLTLDFPNALDISKAIADQRPILKNPILFSTIQNANFITLDEYDLDFLEKLLFEHKNRTIRVLIFPNDIRKTPFFSSCNHCPHWIQEVYGQLKIEAQKYTSDHTSQ